MRLTLSQANVGKKGGKGECEGVCEKTHRMIGHSVSSTDHPSIRAIPVFIHQQCREAYPSRPGVVIVVIIVAPSVTSMSAKNQGMSICARF